MISCWGDLLETLKVADTAFFVLLGPSNEIAEGGQRAASLQEEGGLCSGRCCFICCPAFSLALTWILDHLFFF